MSMSTPDHDHLIVCNQASPSTSLKKKHKDNTVVLEYERLGKAKPNIRILLPQFVSSVYHLPSRVQDLLELAAYVFAADRMITRGDKDALEYQAWSRSFHFLVSVRDYEFWNREDVKRTLSEALAFMSGDNTFRFTFEKGRQAFPSNLFDVEEFKVDAPDKPSVLLFSGGLDSLAGAINSLASADEKVCLVSHKSGQPGTQRTQDQLCKALNTIYPGRVRHYSFECSLTGKRAPEETQRTRAFLFCSIAYSLCNAFGKKSFSVFENGVTAINFSRRQDLINARASRTTHPKTLALLEKFFSLVDDDTIKIATPFFWMTKTDVLKSIRSHDRQDMIPSSVSCSKTFKHIGVSPQCGACYQCIDRRFAAFGAELEEVDHKGLYAMDFVGSSISDGEAKTAVIDYVRQAKSFSEWNVDHFHDQLLSELSEVDDYIDGKSESERVTKVWELCKRHGEQVFCAARRMRDLYDNLRVSPESESLIDLISQREYLKTPVDRLVDDICRRLRKAIPVVFRKNQPKNENDFNDKVEGILNSDKPQFEREHPQVAFGMAKARPDHSSRDFSLLIESKYLRAKTTASAVTDGVSSDLIKYPKDSHVLFILYDPQRKIPDEQKFKSAFPTGERCTICIIK